MKYIHGGPELTQTERSSPVVWNRSPSPRRLPHYLENFCFKPKHPPRCVACTVLRSSNSSPSSIRHNFPPRSSLTALSGALLAARALEHLQHRHHGGFPGEAQPEWRLCLRVTAAVGAQNIGKHTADRLLCWIRWNSLSTLTTWAEQVTKLVTISCEHCQNVST